MNLETLLEIVPKTIKFAKGEARLHCRWSISEGGWIIGYGHNATVKRRHECGVGKTMLEALVDLNKHLKNGEPVQK